MITGPQMVTIVGFLDEAIERAATILPKLHADGETGRAIGETLGNMQACMRIARRRLHYAATGDVLVEQMPKEPAA